MTIKRLFLITFLPRLSITLVHKMCHSFIYIFLIFVLFFSCLFVDCNITLDLATLDKIPQHLLHILSELCCCKKNYSKFDVLNAIAIYSAFENSLIGDWLEELDLSQYTLSWCSTCHMRITQICTLPVNCIPSSHLSLTFKFTLETSRKIKLSSIESGDLAILTIYDLKDLDETSPCKEAKSVAIPISRYVPFKKLCKDNLAHSFRYLPELSMVLKEKLFIPIRNQIYEDCAVLSTPYLNGLPACVLVKIFKYLNKKDLNSLKCTCRKQYDVYKAFVSNKKRKFE